MDLTIFNPRAQAEPDFLANFVARRSTLDYFLRQVRLTGEGQAATHHLVVAPRGFGKTSLLRRIAIAIRSEPDLHEHFIALGFREEQHNVISLDVFWRNCLQSLLEAREDEQAAESEIAELDAAWEQYAPRSGLKREEQDGEPAFQAFEAHCQRLGRRPVLLIDNLDALLAGLSPQHQWALRRTLQRDEGPLLIAAASRYPESTQDNGAAFFDFFRVHTLDKLSDQDVMQCLRTLALHRGDSGKNVLHLLDTDPGRISALNTLSGGNPRTLNVLYGVLESHMSEDLLTQLGSMLDTFTGWYQARTDELPMQARAVFDALALNWDPITAAALTDITGLDTPTIGSQLSRLEKAGYIESVALSRGKGRNGYQMSERFYNIWYLMRHGPRRVHQRVRCLTVFLQACFNPDERHAMARNSLQEGAREPAYSLALAQTLNDKGLRKQLLDHALVCAERTSAMGDYAELISELKQQLSNQHTSDKTSQMLLQGLTLEEKGQLAEAEATYRQATKLAPEDARPWSNLGYLLHTQLARYDEAETAYLHATNLDPYDARPWFNLGHLLHDQLARYDEAESAYRHAIDLAPNSALPWIYLGCLLGTQLTRHDEAEAAYRHAIDIAPKSTLAWFSLGYLLHDQLARYSEAESAYREAIKLAPRNADLWCNLGSLLLNCTGNSTEALNAYFNGLAVGDDSLLHANCAYTLALYFGRMGEAQDHAQKALAATKEGLTIAGQHLLRALPCWIPSADKTLEHVLAHIDLALNSGDPNLWTIYADDLQRLLWYLVRNGHGEALLSRMEAEQYPIKYAPLYHAVAAAVEGEDHLLRINPETRVPAQRLFNGLSRLLKLYPPEADRNRSKSKPKANRAKKPGVDPTAN